MNPLRVHQDPDGRSGFLVAVIPKSGTSARGEPGSVFCEKTGMDPNLHFSSSLHDVVGVVCSRTPLFREPRGGRTLILHGELARLPGVPASESDVGSRGSGKAKAMLKRYEVGGGSAVGALDGSWAVLVWDPGSETLEVITDRWNTRRVFHSSDAGVHWFSTARTLERHPLEGSEVDAGGVAHFLVNQLPHNGRTLHRGLEVLRPGSVHSLGPEGFGSWAHWSLEITHDHAGHSDRALRDGMHQRLLAAVERRTGERPAPWLALSGGWDSRSILGAAREIGVTDLRCFSYGEAHGGPATDASIAARMASALGHPHRFIPGYELDLFQVLEENMATRGTSQLVMETDAWEAVGSLLRDDGDPPPVLFGDHGVGCLENPFMRSPLDALKSTGVQGLEAVPWLRRLVPHASFRRMAEALEEDRAALLARIPEGMSLGDTRYWLYMDLKLARLLAYREFFAGRWSQPRYPLLDHELVDFVARLPTHARMEKALLKQTAAERFPEVFRMESASDGGPSGGSWFGRKLDEHAARIRIGLREEPSPLDELLPPDVLEKILDGALMGQWESRVGRLRKKLHRDLRHRKGGGWLGRRLKLADAPHPVSPRRFLVCALFARSVLASRMVAGIPELAASRTAP